MTAAEALKQAWLKVAREVVEGNPSQYTASELESVKIGVRLYDPALGERLEQMEEMRKGKTK